MLSLALSAVSCCVDTFLSSLLRHLQYCLNFFSMVYSSFCLVSNDWIFIRLVGLMEGQFSNSGKEALFQALFLPFCSATPTYIFDLHKHTLGMYRSEVLHAFPCAKFGKEGSWEMAKATASPCITLALGSCQLCCCGGGKMEGSGRLDQAHSLWKVMLADWHLVELLQWQSFRRRQLNA